MITNTQKIEHIFAWLLRNESISPAAIDRAVSHARILKVGDSIYLNGFSDKDDQSNELIRASFCREQVFRLELND